MTYREDTAALRAKIDELEGELKHMGGRLERLGELEKQVDELRQRGGVRVPGNFLVVTGVVGLVAFTAVTSLFMKIGDLRRQVSTADANAVNALNQANAAVHNAQQANASTRQLGAQIAAIPPAPPAFDAVVRPGTVAEAHGDVAVKSGDSCTVRVMPAASGDLNCRVEVRCGAEILYGKSGYGYLVCDIEGQKPTFGRDEDASGTGGDPLMTLDLAHDRVVVNDSAPDFSVTIALGER